VSSKRISLCNVLAFIIKWRTKKVGVAFRSASIALLFVEKCRVTLVADMTLTYQMSGRRENDGSSCVIYINFS
jgi:hypothetical protein